MGKSDSLIGFVIIGLILFLILKPSKVATNGVQTISEQPTFKTSPFPIAANGLIEPISDIEGRAMCMRYCMPPLSGPDFNCKCRDPVTGELS